jgi:uncharacterized protein YicC (UPF0701 family)
MRESEGVKRQKWLARAVTVFAALSVDADYLELREREGASLNGVVREAIDAFGVLCDQERSGSWASQEVRNRIREHIARMQEVLTRDGVTDEVRRLARDVVVEVIPGAKEWFRNGGGATGNQKTGRDRKR